MQMRPNRICLSTLVLIGAAVGAAVAGPVGLVVGGTLGALIGHDAGGRGVLARKNQELDNLHRDIARARSQLALVNATRAKTQAELVAFRELLTGLLWPCILMWIQQ